MFEHGTESQHAEHHRGQHDVRPVALARKRDHRDDDAEDRRDHEGEQADVGHRGGHVRIAVERRGELAERARIFRAADRKAARPQ
jgi:hypothetical protein